MTKAPWLQTLLRRRSLWLAAAACLLLLLLGSAVLSQRDWRNRASALERENLSLQLAQLARELTAQSEQLAERTRELAESDAVIRLVQETTDPSADRLELADMSRRDLDALLVLSVPRVVRFSVTVVDGQLSEQPPEPVLMQLVDSLAETPDTANRSSQLMTFTDDRWLAVRPVIGHASPAVLGWVVASRSLSPRLISQIANSVGGTLSVQPGKAVDSIPVKAAGAFGVTTQISSEDSSGLAVLRDASGRAVRVLRLARAANGSGAALSAPEPAGRETGYMLTGLLMLLAIVAVILIAIRRYFRHQRSVDARYKALIDQANDGIVIVDSHTYQVLYTNPAFLGRLGYSNEEAQSLTLTDIFADRDATPESVLSRLVEADSQMALNIQQRCKNGSFFDTEVRCNALDVDGRDVLAYVTHDVSLRRKAEQQLIENQQRLDKMAHHDQLTGLPNRHYLTAFLPQAIEEAKAANTMLGVVFLDLDRFKHINDTRGHETGDKLLQEVASRLRACVRDSDVVIRMGGDEFVVVFRNVKNYDEVTLGAGRIIETLNRPIVIDRHSLQTTGSVGVSLYPRDGANMIELLKHSDTAMYQAKDRGRNNVQMFSHAMNRKLKHRVAVEASLARGPAPEAAGCALSALRQPDHAQDSRPGGFDALVASGARHDSRRSIHSGRRGNRLDRADGQFRAASNPANHECLAQGRHPAGAGVAQRCTGATAARRAAIDDFDLAEVAQSSSGDAAAGNDRARGIRLSFPRRRKSPGQHGAAARSRDQDRHRRLRDRLFELELS